MKRLFLLFTGLLGVGLVGCDEKGKNDSSDGKMYKTVTIGSQTWMAENLNIVTENSWCGGGNDMMEGDCSVYGRLYTWDAALKACPAGWHLPSKEEFESLFVTVGGEDVAAKKLKSKNGWDNGGNGDDAFMFTALPAGGRNSSGKFSNEGASAFFWSSTEGNSDRAYHAYLFYDANDVILFNNNKSIGNSVRCLKD